MRKSISAALKSRAKIRAMRITRKGRAYLAKLDREQDAAIQKRLKEFVG